MNAKQSKLLSSLPTATTDSKGKASTVPEFDSTVIDDDTIKAVNDLVDASSKIALLEEGLKADKEVITATAQVLLDTLADDGNFSKSVRLVTDSASVVVSAMDKFGFSKKDLTLDDLKKEYGEAFVKEHIEVDTTVALNPQVLKDNKLLGELIKLVGEKNFGRFFVKSQTISVAKGFDKVVAGLGKQAREKARNGLIKQAGLSIK